MESLADRLAKARHTRFVGRQAELSLFEDALASGASPFVLAHVYGPGGIGKTALLSEVARLAHASGVGVARVDGRDVEPTPEAFASAADRALDDASGENGRLLLVDTYEEISALDGWLRRTFLPTLQATDLVVIAGRQRPSPDWRVGWGDAVELVPLRALTKADMRAYLEAEGMPEKDRHPIMTFARGHPLALALAAEHVRQTQDASDVPTEEASGDKAAFDPASAPELVGELVARFASAVPTHSHQAALECACIVRTVTLPLLRALLSVEDRTDGVTPEALFAWLRGLAFSEVSPEGVSLHEIVSEALEADLRWRDADRHAALLARARRTYGALLQAASGEAEQHKTLADYAHLYRENALVSPLLNGLKETWSESKITGSGPLREGGADAIRDLVERHHGAPEAETIAEWLRICPKAAEVFYKPENKVAGFLLTLDLGRLSPEERDTDPIVAQAWAAARGSLREGERTLLFRSWLDAEAGQRLSTVQSLVFARTVAHYLSTSSLAISLLLTTEPEVWTPIFEFVGLHRWREAETPDGPAAFGMDWRAVPPEAWLEALASGATARTTQTPPMTVLNEEAFAEAVREALKAYARPHDLVGNPLLEARVVRNASGDEPTHVLQTLLREVAGQLEDGARSNRYFRALDLTYFRPAPTQAIAAERLDLPFSTFRRHLGRGVDHIVEELWRRETRA